MSIQYTCKDAIECRPWALEIWVKWEGGGVPRVYTLLRPYMYMYIVHSTATKILNCRSVMVAQLVLLGLFLFQLGEPQEKFFVYNRK